MEDETAAMDSNTDEQKLVIAESGPLMIAGQVADSPPQDE